MKLSAATAGLERCTQTTVFEQSFHLRYSYPVHFTRGLFLDDNPVVDQVLVPPSSGERARVLIVLDAGLLAHHPYLPDAIAHKASQSKAWMVARPPVVMPGGEAAKNDPGHIEELYRVMEHCKLDRHSFVLALGGGAVLDAVGYAAATCHRGIRLVRATTTVLGQNDSGVGVKNGINHRGLKNFLGTFAPPWAVLNDYGFLPTLARRDTLAGMAEAIKVALIKDAEFFWWLLDHSARLARCEASAVEELIERTAILHLRHISSSGDPFEAGSSRPLDFGHWVAHKLEGMTHHALRHGEAVAIGIALDTLYSVASGHLPAQSAHKVIELIRGLGLPIYHPALELPGTEGPLYLEGLEEFRQHLGGRLSITLLSALGEGLQVHTIDEKRMDGCRQQLAAWAS
jgi:3-dehydroquinate synthase